MLDILDSFYTNITNGHIEVEVGGSGAPQYGRFSHLYNRDLQYSAYWVSHITATKLLDTILYHDTKFNKTEYDNWLHILTSTIHVFISLLITNTAMIIKMF